MPTPLPCNHCGEVCGRIIEYANNDSPPEVEPWDDDLVDSEGYCYCSEDCMKAENSEDVCEYCGEPLENGLCSASCNESAADEGRDIDEDDNLHTI